MDLNKWVLMGRLTKDVKTVSKEGAEKAIAVFTVASNYREKGEEKALFVDVSTFGKTAENCQKYLAKGAKVLVIGRAGYRTWDGDKGKNFNMILNADEVHFLDSKKGNPEEPPF